MELMKRLICVLLALLCVSGCSAPRTPGEPPQTDTQAEQSALPQEELPAPPAEPEPEPEPTLPLEGKTICVDPGHEVTALRVQEPISPYSSTTKEAFVGGACGANQTEEQLNLAVGLRLQTLLEQQGAVVIMTRTTHESDMTSYKRAQLANENHVDLCVRIHADGSTDPSVYGMSMLVPGGDQLAAPEIAEPSRTAGEYVLNAAIAATGAKNNGIVPRSDLTGFNFAEVPTILIEMGFLNNPDEDARMETEAYRDTLAQGMCSGITDYFAACDRRPDAAPEAAGQTETA